MKLIDIIAGARPNFMKIAPVIRELERQKLEAGGLRYRLVHTGQHYDTEMSDVFFNQLSIPAPDINLQVGSGTQAEQVATIMIAYEKLLLQKKSDLCLVFGDVNSTLACSIVAQKLSVAVAHVEAGIRSGDWSMPEEINRLVTDAITDWFFTTSKQASLNLMKAGVEGHRIFFVGNTMIDTLKANIDRLIRPNISEEANLQSGKYFVLTLHRPSNVDNKKILSTLLHQLSYNIRGDTVIFVAHPRTLKILERIPSIPSEFLVVKPTAYLEFNYLIKNARAVITDSGGITEEATVMGVPCLTLRDTTERPETVTVGTNEVIGSDPSQWPPYFETLYSGRWKRGRSPEKWDGCTAARIVKHLNTIVFQSAS